MVYYYYVNKNGERKGPILLKDIEPSEIQPDTLVWCKGMASWQKAKMIDDFTSILSPTPSSVPATSEVEKAEIHTNSNTIINSQPAIQTPAAAPMAATTTIIQTAPSTSSTTTPAAATEAATATTSEPQNNPDSSTDKEDYQQPNRKPWIIGGVVVAIMIIVGWFTMCRDDSYPIESESTYSSFAQDVHDSIINDNEIIEEFITNMYNNRLFEDYNFLETHCSQQLLNKLAEDYDYDGQGYAVWNFRTCYQDGISDESSIISVESLGNGWYSYKFLDMGMEGENHLKCHISDGEVIMDDLTQISA